MVLTVAAVLSFSGRTALFGNNPHSSCSRACHANTAYCIARHTTLSQDLLKIATPVYMASIRCLKMSGNYKLACLLVFALGFPLLNLFLLVKALSFYARIQKVKAKPFRHE